MSPLLVLSIGYVSQFPLEYMHLVCLGATHRLLLPRICGKFAVKISIQMADTISNDLKNLVTNVTAEFGRKLRLLQDTDR